MECQKEYQNKFVKKKTVSKVRENKVKLEMRDTCAQPDNYNHEDVETQTNIDWHHKETQTTFYFPRTVKHKRSKMILSSPGKQWK